MKLSFSWLKDHIKTEAPLESIVTQLNKLGLVVDSISHPGERLKGFKIVSILKAIPHPNADRLKVLTVDTGQEHLQVVCGGANAREGIKGILALPGSKIPSNGMVMKIASVRGVESHGMMCSEKELELAETSEGIIELPQDAPVGGEFVSYSGLDDAILDVEITPNRGDCLSARGIARDLAATSIGTLLRLVTPEVKATYNSPISVSLANSAACPYFAGRHLRGLTNKESPNWLQKKLQAIGIRPISALVDITNFLCFDRGRPMHVFDARTINGNLEIRDAIEGESFLALDGKTYTLSSGMTVIADNKGPLSLAGIIGGQESGAQLDTTSVFLESALFDSISIAMTGRKLGIITDSRFRFERGVDPAIIDECLEQATQLILDICGGEASDIVRAGECPHPTKTIIFDFSRIQSLGGINLPKQEAQGILERLGCHVQNNDVLIPSWRRDLEGSADLVEEVLRVKGYEFIPSIDLSKAENNDHLSETATTVSQKRRWIARRVLASQGFYEAFTWSFLNKRQAELFDGGNSFLKLDNPISSDLSDMRPSLLPNLLSALSRNQSRGLKNPSLFEIGHQFKEASQILVATGIRAGDMGHRHWSMPVRPVDFFDIKADISLLLSTLGFEVSTLQLLPEAPSWYHPGRSGSFKLGPKITLASFGDIHPLIKNTFDIDGPVVAFECYLDALPLSRKDMKKKAIFLSPYQSVERDFAFILDEDAPADRLVTVIRKVDAQMIREVRVFDLYQGTGVPPGKKSMAIAIRIEPQDATLTESQISVLSDKIISAAQQIGAQLRT